MLWQSAFVAGNLADNSYPERCHRLWHCLDGSCDGDGWQPGCTVLLHSHTGFMKDVAVVVRRANVATNVSPNVRSIFQGTFGRAPNL